MTYFFFWGFAIILFLFFAWFAFVSYKEKEPVATQRSLISMMFVSLSFIALSFLPGFLSYIFLLIIGSSLLVLLVAFLIPFKKVKKENEESDYRIDERITMFSRKEITFYPDKTKAYYKLHPEHKRIDAEWQGKPGLMNRNSSMFDATMFAAAEASFSVIEKLRNNVNPCPASQKHNGSHKELTTFLKKWATKLGAVDLGICELKSNHFYSHCGRGAAYAITVEMDKDFLATGPAAPTVMESAQQYLNSGTIALQMTYFIANLGYSARAHIDGNYEVVCPLVARDAGLGEIGRMGLLMTPKLGPRVRIAVVTTDLPLIADNRNYNATVHDFCEICKKCADICPSQAISKEPKKEIQGIKRWQINQEKCFSYWCSIGTDCGRCMSVCPFSHPNNLLHNMVRLGIKHSWLFRYFALWMDDLFYGRKPKPKKFPKGIFDK
jgi:ferredoxin